MDARGEILDTLCKRLRALMGEAQHHSDEGDGSVRVMDALRRMSVAVCDARLEMLGPVRGEVLQARQREISARSRARKVSHG